jgi:hypothetical protein
VWRGDWRAVHPIVITAVLELFLDSPAHFKDELWRNGNVAQIKETVYVSAHQNAIFDFVLASLTVWKDVGGFEGGECAFTSDGAPSPVEIGHEYPEGALAQPRANWNRLAETRLRSGGQPRVGTSNMRSISASHNARSSASSVVNVLKVTMFVDHEAGTGRQSASLRKNGCVRMRQPI